MKVKELIKKLKNMTALEQEEEIKFVEWDEPHNEYSIDVIGSRDITSCNFVTLSTFTPKELREHHSEKFHKKIRERVERHKGED